MDFNDIANEKFNNKNFNDIDTFNQGRYELKVENRSDGENEALAEYLMEKLSSYNNLPFLAVGYSGIPRTTIDRHVTTAIEKGDSHVQLFMHLIRKEPLWRTYQEKKAQKRATEGQL